MFSSNYRNKNKLILGTITILSVFLFMTAFIFLNEPIGDDVLYYFENGVSYYLDEVPNNLGRRITTINQVIESTQYIYLHWSGRFVGYLLTFLGKLFPRIVTSAISSGILVANIILALRIIYKDTIKAISSPVAFVVMFFASYWYRLLSYFTYMWTFITIYSFTAFCCLLFYNLVIINYKKNNAVVVFLVGLLAGIGHEVISLCVLVGIVVKELVMIRDKEIKISYLTTNVGFLIGYFVGFCAPGNFNRINESHDAISESLISRLLNSLGMHKAVLMNTKGSNVLFSIVIIAAIVSLVLCNNKKQNILFLIKDNIDFIFGFMASIAIWALFHHVAPYHVELWVISFYIFIFKIIFNSEFFKMLSNKSYASAVSVIFVVSVFLLNCKEMKDFYDVAIKRKEVVNNSSENVVEIPKYKTILSRDRYYIDSLNDQKTYDREYFVAFYNKRLIVK